MNQDPDLTELAVHDIQFSASFDSQQQQVVRSGGCYASHQGDLESQKNTQYTPPGAGTSFQTNPTEQLGHTSWTQSD